MFLAIDLETTGLDPREDRILQVAWQVLNDDLTDRADPNSFICSVDRATLDRIEANLIVLNMHTKTGLWANLQNPAVNKLVLSDIEDEIIRNLDAANALGREPVYLLGASVHFDRSFIDSWMPRLSFELNHRILDTSTLKLVAKAAWRVLEVKNPHPHNAKFDVKESIDIARLVVNEVFQGEVLPMDWAPSA